MISQLLILVIVFLCKSEDYDLAIIGSGISGLSSALSATKRGINGSKIILFSYLGPYKLGALMDPFPLKGGHNRGCGGGNIIDVEIEMGVHMLGLMEQGDPLGLYIGYPFDYALPELEFKMMDSKSNEISVVNEETGEVSVYTIDSGIYFTEYCYPFPARRSKVSEDAVLCVNEIPKNSQFSIKNEDIMKKSECNKKFKLPMKYFKEETQLKNLKTKVVNIRGINTENIKRRNIEEDEYCYDENNVPYAVKIWIPWFNILDNLLSLFPEDSVSIYNWWFFTLDILNGAQYQLTTEQVLDMFFPTNNHLKNILLIPVYMMGEHPSIYPYTNGKYIDLLFYTYAQPFYLPTKGTKQIKELLLEKLEEEGVTIQTSATVVKLLDDGQGNITGVRLSDNSEINAKYVISTTGVQQNYEVLAPDHKLAEYQTMIENATTTQPFFYAWLLFDGKYEDYGLEKRAYTINSDIDICDAFHDFNDPTEEYNPFKKLPVVILTNGGTSEEWLEENRNMTLITVMAPINANFFSEWEGTSTGQRPRSYYRRKNKIFKSMMKMVTQRFPNINLDSENLLQYRSASPLTFDSYTKKGYKTGFGGYSKSYFERPDYISTTMPGLNNIFIAGNDWPWGCGVPVGISSGYYATQLLCTDNEQSLKLGYSCDYVNSFL